MEVASHSLNVVKVWLKLNMKAEQFSNGESLLGQRSAYLEFEKQVRSSSLHRMDQEPKDLRFRCIPDSNSDTNMYYHVTFKDLCL